MAPFWTTVTEPSSLDSAWPPCSRSMIARRRAASPIGPSTNAPAESGPRCTIVAFIASNAPASTGPAPSSASRPEIPHTSVARQGARHRTQGVGRDLDDGGEDRAQVQADRAVGDVLHVVGELLGPGHLAGEPELRQAGKPGRHDQ